MIKPPSLHPGDTVAIVAPARKVSPAEIEPAIRQLRKWGWNVKEGDHLYGECNQYSGNDYERCDDLQQMLDDPSVRAVFAARGGYGTLRILDSLDFTAFVSKPKWIVGFSDITILHSHIHALFGIETMHAAMPFTFPADGRESNAIHSLHGALTGERTEYSAVLSPLSREGMAEGILTGGNLSMLYALTGSVSDIETRGKILFIEDLDEYLYHIDRMMMNLRRSGKLSGLAGLIVGGMTKMNDNTVAFGKTAEEIVAEAVAAYDYPVCFGFPAGHLEENLALILGRKLRMEVRKEGVSVKFDLPETKR